MNYSITSKTMSLSEMSLAQLPGIGQRTPRALAKYGMETVGQFASLTEGEVVVLLGRSGLRLLRLARALVQGLLV
jgi:nucleotidyltransferase/DNA polymerase involved in DNA repair